MPVLGALRGSSGRNNNCGKNCILAFEMPRVAMGLLDREWSPITDTPGTSFLLASFLRDSRGNTLGPLRGTLYSQNSKLFWLCRRPAAVNLTRRLFSDVTQAVTYTNILHESQTQFVCVCVCCAVLIKLLVLSLTTGFTYHLLGSLIRIADH